MNPKDIIRERFYSKGSKPEDAKTLAGLLRINERELYSTSDRYLFELIQNADDKPSPGGAVSIRIELTDNYLVILHNGMPFSEGDVRAICDAAQSNKAKDATKTGYKGIGFKSVFTDARTVYIRSGDYCFKFDSLDPVYQTLESLYKYELDGMLPERRAKELKDWTAKPEYLDLENIPWQIKPIWVEYEAVPGELTATSFRGDATVAFALYVTAQTLREKDYEGTIQGVMADHRLLLFLRHVEEIHFENRFTLRIQRDPETKIRTILSTDDDQHYISGTFGISISDENFKAAGVDIRRVEGYNGQRVFQTGSGARIKEIPEKLAHLDESSLTFCALLVDGKLKVDNESILFNYLPTEDERFKFPFLVNGDFITTSNRERIQHENVWNIYLFHRIGYLAVQWLHELMDRFRDSYLNMLRYPSNPGQEREDLREILEAYKKGFESALGDIRFLWDSEGHRRLVSEVTLDGWGVHEVIPMTVLSEAGYPGPYIASDLVQLRRVGFNNLISHYGRELNLDDYKEILSSAPVQQWMRGDVDRSVCVLQWLVDNKQLPMLKDVTLYPGANGELYKARQIYADLDEERWGWLGVPVVHPAVRDLLNDQAAGLLQYDVAQFVRDEVILKVKWVRKHIAQEDHSIQFYRALVAEQGYLTEAVHFSPQGLKSFDITLESGKHHSWQEGRVFIYDNAVAELLDNRALPVNHLPMIHRQYLDGAKMVTKEQELLWTKLGATVLGNDEEALKAFIGNPKDLCQHFSDLLPDERLKASRLFWAFLGSRFLSRITNDGLTSMRHLLKQLPVLAGPDMNVGLIEKTYLLDENIRERIEGDPEIGSKLISSGYFSDERSTRVRSVFTKCGIKTSLDDFLPAIFAKIAAINLDDHTLWVKFLYENRKKIHFGALKEHKWCLMTQSGERLPVDQVSLLSFDLRERNLTTLPCISIPTLLDERLIFNEERDLIHFYKDMGCQVIDDENAFLSKKMEALEVRVQAVFSKEESIAFVHCLAAYANLSELVKNYSRHLSCLPLMVSGSEQQPEFRPANELFIDSGYTDSPVNQDILNGAGLACKFVSTEYKIDELAEGLSTLLSNICRKEFIDVVKMKKVFREDIPTDYLAYIDSCVSALGHKGLKHLDKNYIENYCQLNVYSQLRNPRVLELFWAKVKENESLRNDIFRQHVFKYSHSHSEQSLTVDSPVVFVLKQFASIPCMDQSWAVPRQCYWKENEKYFPENRITELEVLEMHVNKRPIYEILGIRNELGLHDVLEIIGIQPDFNRLNQLGIWTKLKELLKKEENATPQDKESMKLFLKKGRLPNQLSDFVSVKDLCYIKDESILGTRRSKKLLHKSLITVAPKFQIKSLDDQFIFYTNGERIESDFIHRIRERLPIIAGICDPDHWEECSRKWMAEFNAKTFYSVSSMMFRCENPEILGSQLSFHDHDNCIYYKELWSSQKAADLPRWLYDKLFGLQKLSGKNGIIEYDFFHDILLDHLDKIYFAIQQRDLQFPDELMKTSLENPAIHVGQLISNTAKTVNSLPNTHGADKTISVSGYNRRPPGSNSPSFLGYNESGEIPGGAIDSDYFFNGEFESSFIKLLGKQRLAANEMKDGNLFALYKAFNFFKSQPGVIVSTAQSNLKKTYSHYCLDSIAVGDTIFKVMCRSAHRGHLAVTGELLQCLSHPDYKLFISTGRSEDDFRLFHSIEELHQYAEPAYFFKVHPQDKKRVTAHFLETHAELYDQASWIIPVRDSSSAAEFTDPDSAADLDWLETFEESGDDYFL